MKGKDNKYNKNDIQEERMEEEVNSDLEAVQEDMKEDVSNKDSEKEQSTYLEKIKELEDLNSRYLRLQADFNNYKKRVEKDRESLFAYATQDLLTKLLPAIDNFDRAMSSATDKNDGFYHGMDLIYQQLIDVLKNNGLEEIKALGEKFDPNLHHGVSQEESNEHDEDTIIEVFQKGYKVKDRVLRPSMVKITK